MIKSDFLKKGDKISIIASGYGNCDEGTFNATIKEIEKYGYKAKFTEGLINEKIPYHANTDEFRADDLYNALCDEEIKAIWCLKGGYGSGRIIPLIKDRPAPKHSKFIIGFSDITCLHFFLHENWNMTCIHGSNATGGVQPEKYDYIGYKDVHNIISGNKSDIKLPFISLNEHKVDTKGEITGGNLMLSANSIGTSWQINTKNKVLVFEDIDETGYQVDRSLNHLKQAGLFDNVKAVVFGDFGHNMIQVEDDYCDYAIQRFAEEVNFPVVRVKDIGHLKVNRAFIYGQNVKLDFKSKIFEI